MQRQEIYSRYMPPALVLKISKSQVRPVRFSCAFIYTNNHQDKLGNRDMFQNRKKKSGDGIVIAFKYHRLALNAQKLSVS